MKNNLLLSKHNMYTVISHPVFTEKSQLAVSLNQYTFVVNERSTKIKISNAIKFLYGVDVSKVRTIKYACRKARTMRGVKTIAGYKKAIITIAKGQSIDFEKLV